MKKIVYYNKLFDVYKNLLKEDEIETFSDYYEEDLSMQEIADNQNISKSAVGKKISNVEKKLVSYEESLNIVKKNELLEELLLENDINIIKKRISIILK
ncbi:MAG: DNA-binding protein [Firmicutes bacterium]|nr:DNA-binding protein [Bacillota bacterium]